MDLILEHLAALYGAAVDVEDSAIADIASIYEGEPHKLPESDLPALVLEPAGTTWRGTQKSGSQYDVREARVRARLIMKRKDFYASNYGEDGNAKKIFVEEKAAEMTEATDNSQHTDVTSLCGVVQNNQTLKHSGVRASSMCLVESVEYDAPPPRARGFDSYEVVVDIVATIRGNRAS